MVHVSALISLVFVDLITFSAGREVDEKNREKYHQARPSLPLSTPLKPNGLIPKIAIFEAGDTFSRPSFLVSGC